MSRKTILTALALAAAALATCAIDAVQAASPVAAGFKVPAQQRDVGGFGHTPTALPMPPRCTKPKLPLPGCRTP